VKVNGTVGPYGPAGLLDDVALEQAHMEKLSAHRSGAEIEGEGAKRLAHCVKRSGIVGVRKYSVGMRVGAYTGADFVGLKLRYYECEVADRRHDAEDHSLKSFELQTGEIPEIRAWNEEGACQALVADGVLEDGDSRRVHGVTSWACWYEFGGWISIRDGAKRSCAAKRESAYQVEIHMSYPRGAFPFPPRERPCSSSIPRPSCTDLQSLPRS
jgi:hypothetical protein